MKIEKKTKAIIFMLISAMGFTLMSVAVKFIPQIPLFQKIFVRNLISCLVAGFVLISQGRGFSIKRENFLPLFYRSFFGYIGVITNFYAVEHLYLADSNMLNKLSPITVSIFAVIFLKEKVDAKQIIGIILSFIGALFVIKPTFSMSIIPSLSGLLSATLAGLSYTCIRYLNNKENPNIIVFYFSLFSVLGSMPLAVRDFVTPTFTQWLFLIAIGAAACLGQFFLTYAYKNAPASEVSIYNYSGIPYGIILGFLFFGEIPDIYSIIGGIIIVVVAIYLYKHNKNKLSK